MDASLAAAARAPSPPPAASRQPAPAARHRTGASSPLRALPFTMELRPLHGDEGQTVANVAALQPRKQFIDRQHMHTDIFVLLGQTEHAAQIGRAPCRE